ncbi:MAG TPA: hypothetical protein VK722_11970 [Candidatus Aquilonibacter sp.]|jgi:hypothetical protein|nr:hypothetical protein [Candidatus Aquilonibacter sp.]
MPIRQSHSRNQSSDPFTNFNKNLLNYAAAAGAASVGMLALAQPSLAEVVYTKADIPITGNTGVIQFDINNDGIPDFGISNAYGTCEAPARLHNHTRHPEGCSFGSLRLVPAQASNEVGVAQSCAAELRGGLKVGPAKNFPPGTWDMFWEVGNATSTHKGCPWTGNNGGYLGLKFVVDGETHFGWARVSLKGGVTITGYAYETTPNKSIETGATSGPDEKVDASSESQFDGGSSFTTLGLLARGASGLQIWRDRKTRTENSQ